jgi:hypothetical protein
MAAEQFFKRGETVRAALGGGRTGAHDSAQR